MEKQLSWPISCTCLTKRTLKIIADLDRNILNITLTLYSDIPCSEGCRPAKQEEEEEINEMEKWAYFTIRQKS